MVIPILMQFCACLPSNIFVLSQIRAVQVACHLMKSEEHVHVINDAKLFLKYIAGYIVANLYHLQFNQSDLTLASALEFISDIYLGKFERFLPDGSSSIIR